MIINNHEKSKNLEIELERFFKLKASNYMEELGCRLMVSGFVVSAY